MSDFRSFAAALAALLLAPAAAAQITLYEGEAFHGRAFTAGAAVSDLQGHVLDNRGGSAIVAGGRWEVCDLPRFGGRCIVLRPGGYDALHKLGLADVISSMRPAGARGQPEFDEEAQVAQAGYAYRQRPGEQVFPAPVTRVRAVLFAGAQACWFDAAQADAPQPPPAARLGGDAPVGWVLAHQPPTDAPQAARWAGPGKAVDAGSPEGAVVWAAAPVDVLPACALPMPWQQPAYWNVEYRFGGREHQAQLTTPPGPAIFVNAEGVPRQ